LKPDTCNLKPEMRDFLIDLRQRAEYAVLRSIAATLRSMPLDAGANVSGKLWRMLAPFSRRRHRRALANLAIAFPEKSPAEREAIARAMWENLGRVMAETMQIDRIIAEPDRIQLLPGAERLHTRYKDKMGAAIGVTLHMGNWELAAWPLTVAGDLAAVYRSVNNPYVDRWLRHLRRNLYPGGLLGKGRINGSPEEGQRTARLITDFVRRGGRLGLVCDLYDRTGIPVPFFGKPAPSVAIAGMIARRVGARIWFGRCLRVGKQSRFIIELKELKVPRTASPSDDVKWITAAMQAQFEAWIRETPEQWMWSNRRWS
jgi:Kdo2-lipid IVA lauroyltransferase/acyltransferase